MESYIPFKRWEIHANKGGIGKYSDLLQISLCDS